MGLWSKSRNVLERPTDVEDAVEMPVQERYLRSGACVAIDLSGFNGTFG